MLRIAWHGCAAFTLDLDGHELLVDPFFTRSGQLANPHAPTAHEYMASHRPERVLITSGRADHCDLGAIGELTAIRPLEFVCSEEVAAALQRECGVAEEHLTAVAPGSAHTLEAVRLEVFPAAPPPAGAVASAGGGPALSLLVGSGDKHVYLSGDTSVDRIPEMPAPVAVLCVGGRVQDPATGEMAPHTLTPADVPEAARRLHARAIVPVEWDLPLCGDPLDLENLRQRLAEEVPDCAVTKPPYNTWSYIEDAVAV
jgi:L-ascorbate metabolism protein UlaG (beta-lactamase superfamily)